MYAAVLALGMVLPVSAAPEIRITESGTQNSRELRLQTRDILDATVVITITGKNVRSDPPSPIILDTAGRTNFVAARVFPAKPGESWNYSFRYSWRTGGQGGRPDSYIYLLPFKEGSNFQVTQGYLGTFSHKECGENQFSIDWRMPQGTPVHAARDGMVVAFRADSNSGGPSERFGDKANYVTIRHSDGTYADYMHLQLNGVRVKLGEKVKTGQVIGLSGNTGFSTEPHLHFSVFRNRMQGAVIKRESLPVLIQGVDSKYISPRGSCVPEGLPAIAAPPRKIWADLVLNGIWKQATGNVAIINGDMFKEGEKGSIRLPDKKVEILCQKIDDDSVVVLVDGEETAELKLRQ